MPKLAGISGDIVHTTGVRYRVKGSGSLRTRLYNMGEITATNDSLRNVDLDDVALDVKSNREKTVLANFQDQGVQIYFRTIHMDEIFNITKIICFVKGVAESYPVKSGG